MSNSNGSSGSPFNLKSALTHPGIGAGHTVWFADGTYRESVTCVLNGASGNPITLKPLNAGARVILDNNVLMNGSYLEFHNIEFAYDGWTTRLSASESESPSDLPDIRLDVHCTGVKLINCVIHDLITFGFWIGASNAELNGCIIYHIGWKSPTESKGHGVYTQNSSGTKLIKDCIVFSNFNWNIHAYSTTGVYLLNFSLIGNTCFNGGILGGTERDGILVGADANLATGTIISENMTYNNREGLLEFGAGMDNPSINNNYCPDGASIGAYTGSGNYFGDSGIGNQVFVRANDYDSNRANITIYNQAQANPIAVSVSSVLSAGDSYRLRNVQDYFVDIQMGTVAVDGTITVNMQAANRSVQAPVAWDAPATTFPNFGCFVLEKVA